MFNFKEKTVYITGASGGIAMSCIKKFYNAGANLILTDLHLSDLEAVCRTLNLAPEKVLLMAQDVRNPEDAITAVEEGIKKFGSLDIVIPCAGFYPKSLVKDLSDLQWKDTLSINLDGVFYTIRAAIPYLQDGGAIVNITSIAGHKGSFKHGHYATAKGAVLTLTRTLALELAPAIRVNNVSPGLIDTAMIQDLMNEQGDLLISQTPLNRLGTSDEIANAVMFLASNHASFITGETLHVNGGLYIAS
ncbi:SDR family oxidoreductase [Ignatzschineria rhizosphaerae]|uniref:SDR family oxidoreductase n=1 Tax=Ignatzschineria rhizosphaerae TaxID=2923279 RepID=A0ABY3X205_9GAMM|nr:SDR family NAD(P)-dependent oxidoreductase [Ignatzschineria rhizosphaerae]UNM96909.1 SDR family oxidoreductase [Ignatzschineria rhizosphaerae]